MSSKHTTIADTISATYGDDGTTWYADDVYLEDALRAAGAKAATQPGGGACRWTLPDGSVITTSGDAWDLGYPECWCWQGNGHDRPDADGEGGCVADRL